MDQSELGMFHTTKNGMEKFHMILPPLPEQQRIVSILERIDAIETQYNLKYAHILCIKFTIVLILFTVIRNHEFYHAEKNIHSCYNS